MIAVEKARMHLEQLGLAQATEVLDGRLESAARTQTSYADFLVDLLSVEAMARRERCLVARIRLAHLPFRRTLEEFDLSFQPSIDNRQIKELATLGFVSGAPNVILLGPPGVGKTHLAVGLGIKAIRQGHEVYFIRAEPSSKTSAGP